MYWHTISSKKVTVGLPAVVDSASGTEAAVTAPEQPLIPLSSCPEMPMASLTEMRAFESEVDTTILEDTSVNWQELSPFPPTSSNEAASKIPGRGEDAQKGKKIQRTDRKGSKKLKELKSKKAERKQARKLGKKGIQSSITITASDTAKVARIRELQYNVAEAGVDSRRDEDRW